MVAGSRSGKGLKSETRASRYMSSAMCSTARLLCFWFKKLMIERSENSVATAASAMLPFLRSTEVSYVLLSEHSSSALLTALKKLR